MRNSLAYSNLNSILVTANLGAGSPSYQSPCAANTALFGTILITAAQRDTVTALITTGRNGGGWNGGADWPPA